MIGVLGEVLKWSQDKESCITWTLYVFVFFQAEDGIRDLVRSRGLGDVYKRQPDENGIDRRGAVNMLTSERWSPLAFGNTQHTIMAVSYTHLTLPTSDLV